MSNNRGEDATIAVIFDFDDTLAPDSTTALLREYDIDAESFWDNEFQSRVTDGFDPTIATLSLVVEKIRNDGELAELTADRIEAVGENLNEDIFQGVAELLDDFADIAAQYEGVTIEPYIISEGLRRVIAGTDLAESFEEVYASELSATSEGNITGIKRAISFTDKTRYLFEINKGIPREESLSNPYAVNTEYDPSERTVPFENIIYVGDGLTDIPCFSLVQDRNGRAFGVYDEENPSLKQQAILNVGSPQRTQGSTNTPGYRKEDRLGSILRLTVEGLCADRTIDSMEVNSRRA